MAPLPYEKTRLKRGFGYLILNQIFVLASKRPTCSYLKCQSFSSGCPATAKIKGEEAFVLITDHSHDPPSTGAAKFRSHLLEEIKKPANSRNSTQFVYDTARNELAPDDDSLGKLPTFDSIRSSMHRSRSETIPTAPKKVDQIDLNFMANTWKHDNGDPFYLCDSGPAGDSDPGRIFIFGAREDHLSRIGLCDALYCDGTFWVVPSLFYQLFTIHVEVYQQIFPLFYCLLPDKTEETYVRMFIMLKNICHSLNIQLNFNRIVSDFELALINAIARVFPGVQHQGCLFHFAQAIFRKVQDLGYATDYRNNEHFRKNVRLFIALGMVPAAYKYTYFLQIPKQDPRIAEISRYFYSTWFNRYSPSVWDFFEKDRRTNNAVEAWHSRIKRFFKIAHMSIYRFGTTLLQEAKKVDKNLKLRLDGEPLPRRKAQYDAIDTRFQVLFEEFPVRYPIDYISGFVNALPEPRGF